MIAKDKGNAMPTLAFDDHNIAWQTTDGFDHAAFFILNVDESARSVDLLFKFAANGTHRAAPTRRSLSNARPAGRTENLSTPTAT